MGGGQEMKTPGRPRDVSPWDAHDSSNGSPASLVFDEILDAALSPPASPILNVSLLRSACLLPGQERSLSGVSLRAFLLGVALGLSVATTIALAWWECPIWRAPFFLSALALFHFLEFFVTAAFNTQTATLSAFLLSRNGQAYNIAHTAAMTECIITSLILPSWQARVTGPKLLALGFSLLVMGQATRTIAMAHAGTNFNHTVQVKRARGHHLVSDGIYAYLRHPSYFGFFWWGLGTQIVCGNVLCVIGYSVVLWIFFRKRIQKEEDFLLDFFGRDYSMYRKRTRVGIPFIP